MDTSEVAAAIVHMASLPLSTNILTMTIMATKMPFVGRMHADVGGRCACRARRARGTLEYVTGRTRTAAARACRRRPVPQPPAEVPS